MLAFEMTRQSQMGGRSRKKYNISTAVRTASFLHSADESAPDEVYEVDVEKWSTTTAFPKGYRLVLSLMGKDFEFPGVAGRILHQHPTDHGRPEFQGTNRVLTGGGRAFLLDAPVVNSTTP